MTADERARHIDVILRMLMVQLDGHERLLGFMEKKRTAIRSADLGSLTQLSQEEYAIVRKLSELERNRLQVTQRFAGDWPEAEKGEPVTVEMLATRTDSRRAERIRDVASRLRECVLKVRRESAIIAEATKRLAGHVSGLMQTVQKTVNRTGVYGRGGSVSLGQTEFCVDIKS